MLRTLIQLAISLAVILAATWLAKRYPGTSGFVTALPITTMLVLALSHADGATVEGQAAFARSLLVALPLSATFLVPFALAPRLDLGFHASFALGLVCLALGYAVHRSLVGTG